MLRLLAQREEGYEDIGALMGLSVSEVRARVRDALAELESGDAQAPPASAPAPGQPEAPAPEPAPQPTRPAAAEAAPRRARPTRESPAGALGKSLQGNRRLQAGVIGCALLVVLLVLFATGLIDVGGSSSSEAPTAGNPTSSEAPTAVNPTSSSKVPTQAVLKGVGGSEAEGRAIFGRLKSQVLLVVAAKGLPPSPQGSSYAISLARSPEERIPIAASTVGKSGTISGQFQVPATALGLLASGFDEIEVSLVTNGELRVAVTEAQKQKKTPQFKGTDVLRGPVTGPVVENAEEEG